MLADERGSEHVLVVPHAPGPLVDPDAELAEPEPDEIDVAVDDLFGADPGGSPGWFDVVLVSTGLALVLGAEIGGYSRFFTVLGAILLFLGVILPVRSARRAIRRRGQERSRAAAMSRGLALNVGHPLTRGLADAYAELLDAVGAPGVPYGDESVRAAHAALVESARLLHGSAPADAAETAYLEKRLEAMRTLTHAVRDRAVADEEPQDDELERLARARAGEELDALGVSSLNELDDLARLLGREQRDARR